MTACPHTYQPIPHEIEVVRGAVSSCQSCGGLVKICPHCKAANREAALFCVQCGRRPAAPDDPWTLLPPGAIRDGLRAAVDAGVSLGSAFALPAESQPLFWEEATSAGVFLFSARDAARTPARLDLLEQRRLRAARGRLLSDALPPPEQWVARPAVNRHGVFIATAAELQGLAGHGYDAPFHLVRWRPERGRSILAVADLDSEIHLLLRDPAGALSVASGNGQSDAWCHRFTLDLTAAAEQGGFLGTIPAGTALLDGEPGLWIIAGDTLALVEARTGRPGPRHTLAMLPRPIAPRWRQRLALGQFEPLLLGGTDGGRPALAFPHGADAPPGIGLVQLDETPRINRVTQYEPTGWIDRDWDGCGLLVGRTEAVERFNGSQRLWHLATESRINVPALTTERWLITLVVRQDGEPMPGKLRTEVVVAQRGSETDGAPKPILRPLVDGIPAPGLRPLLLGDTLVLATRTGSRDYGLRMAQVLQRAAAST